MKKVSPEDFLDCVHGRKHPDDCEEVASSCNNELVMMPCPFCGGAAKESPYVKNYICCSEGLKDNCYLSGYGLPFHVWNKRAS